MLIHERFACSVCGEGYKASVIGICRACSELAEDVVARIVAGLDADGLLDDEDLDAFDAVLALAGAYTRAGDITA